METQTPPTRHSPTPMNPTQVCLSDSLRDKDRPISQCKEPADLIKRDTKAPDHHNVSLDNPQPFNESEILSDYAKQPSNPMYETTNSEYGKYKPTVHTMPVEYHQRNATFTKTLLTLTDESDQPQWTLSKRFNTIDLTKTDSKPATCF
ncbi:expressed protein [Echinococcus multilocularis]|uniref:Expressed protein n=1 Tax=Echinococcus multilocularis TaxID=6211 RepID=A0A087W187_ECHMU|nr:expressed protein [Echinococcus multilocularis]